MIVARWLARGETLAVAESLTGGLLAATIVDVPGASAAFRGGLVVYATDLKATLAGVDPVLLAERGPVDPDVAAALAVGARTRCGADWGVSHHRRRRTDAAERHRGRHRVHRAFGPGRLIAVESAAPRSGSLDGTRSGPRTVDESRSWIGILTEFRVRRFGGGLTVGLNPAELCCFNRKRVAGLVTISHTMRLTGGGPLLSGSALTG